MVATKASSAGRYRVALLLAAVLLIAAGLMSAYGQRRAAAQPDTQPAALTAPLSVEWRYTGVAFPNNPVSPIVSGGTVYYASGDRIYALDAASGSLRWNYPSGGFMANPVQADMALSGDTLFVPTGTGLMALDASDGHLRYPAFRSGAGGAVTTPVVSGPNVFFGSSDGRLFGLNTDTGQPINANWGRGLQVGADFMGDMASGGGTLYFATSNNVLHAVDAGAATQKWARDIDSGGENVTPVLTGETLYLADGAVLSEWRVSNGQLLWRMAAHNPITASPAVDSNGNMYLVTSGLGVYALDPERRPIWKTVPTVDYDVNVQPVISGNLLIVCTSGGGVYAFDKATGALRWNYSIQPSSADPTHVPTVNRVASKPAVTGDGLYVLTDDGSLTLFRHDAVDEIPPVVSDLEPARGEYCSGEPPFTIKAKVVDSGSGLEPSSLQLHLDNQEIPRRANLAAAADKPGFVFNKDDSILTYTILPAETGVSHTLTDGHHTATISARDWKGNEAVYSWIFTVGSTYPKEKEPGQANGQGRPGGAPGGFPGKGGGGGGVAGGGGQ